MRDQRNKLRVAVNYEVLSAFARRNFGSIKEMATGTGVGERTLHRTKETGFISLGTAIEVCMLTGSPLEDVFGRQSGALRNVSWMFPTDEPTFIF